MSGAGQERAGRVYLAAVVGEDEAHRHAMFLRDAGVHVTRDSSARWYAHRGDPRVAAWLEAREAEGRTEGRHGG